MFERETSGKLKISRSRFRVNLLVLPPLESMTERRYLHTAIIRLIEFRIFILSLPPVFEQQRLHTLTARQKITRCNCEAMTMMTRCRASVSDFPLKPREREREIESMTESCVSLCADVAAAHLSISQAFLHPTFVCRFFSSSSSSVLEGRQRRESRQLILIFNDISCVVAASSSIQTDND